MDLEKTIAGAQGGMLEEIGPMDGFEGRRDGCKEGREGRTKVEREFGVLLWSDSAWVDGWTSRTVEGRGQT